MDVGTSLRKMGPGHCSSDGKSYQRTCWFIHAVVGLVGIQCWKVLNSIQLVFHSNFFVKTMLTRINVLKWIHSSTFAVTGNQWRYAAKATCTTMVASFGGGLVSLVYSFYQTSGKIDVLMSVNGVLGALVGITGTHNVILMVL